ncbi:MAG: EscU/YscU/HrcU family type III secretion system export apparatus switch protein [Planctomycetota bacterium]
MSSDESARFPGRAVALRYRESEIAPTVTAAGRGAIAERIIERAKSHGIPIHEDPELVEAMAALKQGEAIPEELYLAVAQVLAWILAVGE